MKLSNGSRLILWLGFNAGLGMLLTDILPSSLNSRLILLDFVWTFVSLNLKQALLAGFFVLMALITIYRGETLFGKAVEGQVNLNDT